MSLFIQFISFIIVISVLVVVHEYGHYCIARLCGVKILQFSIGFGKPILQWTSKKTGCIWTISIFPFGGYVKMLDENELSSNTILKENLSNAFSQKSPIKRIAIVLAGPLFNILLAIILFIFIFLGNTKNIEPIIAKPFENSIASQSGFIGGEKILSISDINGNKFKLIKSWDDLRVKLIDTAYKKERAILVGYDGEFTYNFTVDLSNIEGIDINSYEFMSKLGFEIGGALLKVSNVKFNSIASRIGIMVNDILFNIDGYPIDDIDSFISYLHNNIDKNIYLKIKRKIIENKEEKIKTFNFVIPKLVEKKVEINKNIPNIGIEIKKYIPLIDTNYTIMQSIYFGIDKSLEVINHSIRALKNMIIGQSSLKSLSGPISIANYAGKSITLGLFTFLSFLAHLSISIGIINLLPIPPLDGGHLLYYLVEIISKRTFNNSWKIFLQKAGFLFIIILSIIVCLNDIINLIN